MVKREFVALGSTLHNGGGAGLQVSKPFPSRTKNSAQIPIRPSNSVNSAAFWVCPLARLPAERPVPGCARHRVSRERENGSNPWAIGALPAAVGSSGAFSAVLAAGCTDGRYSAARGPHGKRCRSEQTPVPGKHLPGAKYLPSEIAAILLALALPSTPEGCFAV